MKKRLLFIAIAGLFTAMASAADLYVRENGANGAYSTVSAAITAASNGDRIIIKPKNASAAYVENLTINKSLTFVSETNYQKYKLQGTVVITPLAGRVVTIHNAIAGSITISGATTGGRTTLNVFNSFLSFLDAGQVNATTIISGCTVESETIIAHGKCTGNFLGSLFVTHTDDTSLATDDVEIIANSVNYGITNYQRNYTFKILNNFLPQSSISVWGVKNGSTNEITNNTSDVRSNGGGQYGECITINLTTGNTGTILIYNNVLALNNDYVIYNYNTNATVSAYYNMISGPFALNNVANQGSNTQGNFTINNNSYSVSGANVNAGSPAVEYTDLDLTRNDAGNGGGSNSWSNYWPADGGNRAQINYLNVPRRITTGTTLNVSGSGFSK
ncbi:hypothetical protein [Flavobacterium cerinum]|uniref:IPT/TIG domain-containing protein n=1 Tax=Flavobacterium cerinum TaxID=2502784 RepID=A0ABY5IMP8_9FLAO|nr:hypothetical protein [Flavobacterium cerinum]UUC44097.1 hypothetical protein NOX80_10680 [Flavobacterium cerinum]